MRLISLHTNILVRFCTSAPPVQKTRRRMLPANSNGPFLLLLPRSLLLPFGRRNFLPLVFSGLFNNWDCWNISALCRAAIAWVLTFLITTFCLGRPLRLFVLLFLRLLRLIVGLLVLCSCLNSFFGGRLTRLQFCRFGIYPIVFFNRDRHLFDEIKLLLPHLRFRRAIFPGSGSRIDRDLLWWLRLSLCWRLSNLIAKYKHLSHFSCLLIRLPFALLVRVLLLRTLQWRNRRSPFAEIFKKNK